MTQDHTRAPLPTAQELAQRAVDELTKGAPADVVTATALVGLLVVATEGREVDVAEGLPRSIRQREPGGYLAGIREGIRRSARATQGVADECLQGSDAERILRRLADSLETQSTGEIRLDKDDR